MKVYCKEISTILGVGVDKMKKQNEKIVQFVNFVDVYKNRFIDNQQDLLKTTCSDQEFKKFMLQYGDILITPSSENKTDIGLTCMINFKPINLVYSYHLNLMRFNLKIIEPLWISYYFYTNKSRKYFYKVSSGITRYTLNKNNLENFEITYPSIIDEQVKISTFLKLLDKQISLLENKLKLTETLSKFNIANFFKKTSKIYNFINFKKIVILNKNKNKSNHQYDVATISNKFGFIRQKEYFGDKTNVASENKKNYYIIDKKSFGFNPARINVGSFGYYNKNEKLLISPIYVSFKINNEIFHDEIIEAYSKTYFFKQNIAKWQTGSVRKSINANDFLNFTIPLIPLKIQNLFVNKKNLLEKHILCLNKKIETLKQRKMFYLENLFI